MGAVNVNILWITGKCGGCDDVPTQMGDWTCPNPGDSKVCWQSFVDYFNLQEADGSPAQYRKNTIYFKPDCSPHERKGRTGGENFGVLAKVPVLVK